MTASGHNLCSFIMKKPMSLSYQVTMRLRITNYDLGILFVRLYDYTDRQTDRQTDYCRDNMYSARLKLMQFYYAN